MFNISTLALSADYELELRDPRTDEVLYASEDKSDESKVVIGLHGTASKQYRNQITAIQQRTLKRGKKPASPEVMREEGVELLVACSAYSKNLELDGEPVQTAAQFRKLYSDVRFSWLKDQVDGALGEVSNFLKP